MKKTCFAFILVAISNQAFAQMPSPPKEAFKACENSSQGSACSFKAPHGNVSGICYAMKEGKMICVPGESKTNSMAHNSRDQSKNQFSNNNQQPQRSQNSPSRMMRVEISAKNSSAKKVKSLVPDTNQGTCFNDYSVISCPKEGGDFYGQDGNYFGATTSYKNNKDGTVSDLVTGLTWQKAHNAQRKSYYSAKQYCESLDLGGHKDWRLPTIKELFSIADFRGAQGKNYFLNSNYFDLKEPEQSILSNDPYSSTHSVGMMGQTWSSTVYSGKHFGRDGVEAFFFFNFLDGHIKQAPSSNNFSLFYRCVRGNIWGENKFVDNSDGTVTDNLTSLQWQQKDDGKTRDWKNALSYCQNLDLAGYKDWRLPSVKELQTIVDYTKNSPALNTNYIKLTNSKAWFWSSTTHGDNITMASYVCFGACTSKDGVDTHGAGAQRSDPKSGYASKNQSLGGQEDEIRINNYVRCVR
ncbi:MAG: DUF1566 domain-containing protein [Pelagibacterales bacterium]|nr:DUF1566 domain-containing protein [Pelagibacterales bacterium]